MSSNNSAVGRICDRNEDEINGITIITNLLLYNAIKLKHTIVRNELILPQKQR